MHASVPSYELIKNTCRTSDERTNRAYLIPALRTSIKVLVTLLAHLWGLMQMKTSYEELLAATHLVYHPCSCLHPRRYSWHNHHGLCPLQLLPWGLLSDSTDSTSARPQEQVCVLSILYSRTFLCH